MTDLRHVLLVDDEPGICSALASALAGDGHRVSCASSAEMALEIARDDSPEILLTDLRMEGRSGVELLEILRRQHPRMQAIVMTGYGSVDELVRCVRLGVVDFVQKPFRIRQIREAIQRCHELRRISGANAGIVEREERVDPDRWRELCALAGPLVSSSESPLVPVDGESSKVGTPEEIEVGWTHRGETVRVRLRPVRDGGASREHVDSGKDSVDEAKRLLWS